MHGRDDLSRHDRERDPRLRIADFPRTRRRFTRGAPSRGISSNPMVQQGDLLAGKYRVENVLGEGGMGYVVAALHEQLDQRVAVKLLSPCCARTKIRSRAFCVKARAAVRIRSEHVARVFDVGELTDGSPYMVMEYLFGRDLAASSTAETTRGNARDRLRAPSL